MNVIFTIEFIYIISMWNFDSHLLSSVSYLILAAKLHRSLVVVTHGTFSGATMLSRYHSIEYAMLKQSNYEFLYLVRRCYAITHLRYIYMIVGILSDECEVFMYFLILYFDVQKPSSK